MTNQDALATLASGLLDGSIQVIDCTAPLGPDTPLLKLPPEIADDTPKIEIHKISQYGDRGPFWAWNWLKIGEHSGEDVFRTSRSIILKSLRVKRIYDEKNQTLIYLAHAAELTEGSAKVSLSTVPLYGTDAKWADE